MIKPFVFNDENKYNCYGFRVLNAGIDMSRFDQNPVMLSEHWMNSASVLGAWEDVKVEGATLTGVPKFDTEDEGAKKVMGKVERGFIKSCSMGFLFKPDDMQYEGDGKYVLNKCELMEVSIVAVPGNANAVRLYAETGELMKEDEIKLCLSGLSDNTNKNFLKTENNMKKVFLSVASLLALGLEYSNQSEGVDASIIDDAINKMKQEADTLKLKLTTAEASLKKYKDAEELKLNADVDQFVASVIPSKYDESERESVVKLAKADLAFAKKMADLVPVKKSLSASVQNTPVETPGEIKTLEDFVKLSTAEQLAFKSANPDAYKKLVA